MTGSLAVAFCAAVLAVMLAKSVRRQGEELKGLESLDTPDATGCPSPSEILDTVEVTITSPRTMRAFEELQPMTYEEFISLRKTTASPSEILGTVEARMVAPCPYCRFTHVHRHDCLEIMNSVRTPDGDWWKI